MYQSAETNATCANDMLKRVSFHARRWVVDILFATVCVITSGVFLLLAVWSSVATIFAGNFANRCGIIALCVFSSIFFYLAGSRVSL